MILFSLICSIGLAYVLARRFIKRETHIEQLNAFTKARYYYLFLVTLFISSYGLRVLSLNHDYTWRLPLYPQAYSTHILVFALNAIIFFTSFILIYLVYRDKKDRITTSIAILFITIFINSIYLEHTKTPEFKNKKVNGIILQSDVMSCAAAAMANASNLLGKQISEEESAIALKTNVQGTNPAQIVLGARKLGFQADIFHQKSSQQLQFPSIIFVDAKIGKEKHAVLAVRKQQDMFEIWDPDKGPYLVSEEFLNSRWHGNGVLISKKI